MAAYAAPKYSSAKIVVSGYSTAINASAASRPAHAMSSQRMARACQTRMLTVDGERRVHEQPARDEQHRDAQGKPGRADRQCSEQQRRRAVNQDEHPGRCFRRRDVAIVIS